MNGDTSQGPTPRGRATGYQSLLREGKSEFSRNKPQVVRLKHIYIQAILNTVCSMYLCVCVNTCVLVCVCVSKTIIIKERATHLRQSGEKQKEIQEEVECENNVSTVLVHEIIK